MALASEVLKPKGPSSRLAFFPPMSLSFKNGDSCEISWGGEGFVVTASGNNADFVSPLTAALEAVQNKIDTDSAYPFMRLAAVDRAIWQLSRESQDAKGFAAAIQDRMVARYERGEDMEFRSGYRLRFDDGLFHFSINFFDMSQVRIVLFEVDGEKRISTSPGYHVPKSVRSRLRQVVLSGLENLNTGGMKQHLIRLGEIAKTCVSIEQWMDSVEATCPPSVIGSIETENA